MPLFWSEAKRRKEAELLQRWIADWNTSHDREAYYRLFDDQCRFPPLQQFGIPPTKDGFRQFFDTFLESFSDPHTSIEKIFFEENGSGIACFITESATHTGIWRGIPPTNKRITFTEWVYYRFEGNKVVDWDYHPNMLALLQQLGAIPAS